MLDQLNSEWEVIEGTKLRRVFEFKGFLKTMCYFFDDLLLI